MLRTIEGLNKWWPLEKCSPPKSYDIYLWAEFIWLIGRSSGGLFARNVNAYDELIRHYARKTYGGVEVYIHVLLNLALFEAV
jgi:hypothetical protein